MNPTQTALFNLKAARPVPQAPPPNRFQLVGYQGQSPIVRVPGGQPFVAGQIETNGAILPGSINTRQSGNTLRIDGLPKGPDTPIDPPLTEMIDWEFFKYDGESWTKDEIPAPKAPSWTKDEAPAISGPVRMQRGQPVAIKIAFQDAINSGGTNDKTQSGMAIARFRGGRGKPIRFTASLNAVIEQENKGFEQLRITAIPEGYKFETPFVMPSTERELYFRDSVGRNLGLQMETIADVLEAQALERGEALAFFSSTIYGLWHVGAFWQATLLFD